MLIKEIELVGYRRFALNGYKQFRMKIDSPLQLILGTNGCGKTSLLEQLTPLAPHHTDFTQDGSKTIYIENEGRSYVLRSRFHPKPHYEFVVDGEEQNPGGTKTVYNSLVKTHFNITPDIHALMLGSESFTKMSSPRRKEWFIRLSTVDFEFAIKVYNKAKEALRDAVGAAKLTKRTLVMESEKVISDEAVAALNAEVDALHRLLNALLELRKPVEADIDMLEAEQQDLDKRIHALAKSVDQVYEQIKLAPYNVEDYEKQIVDAREGAVATSALLARAAEEHSQVSKKLEILRKAEANSIASLEKECSDLLTLIRQNTENCLYQGDLAEADVAERLFDVVKDNLVDLFSSIPADADNVFNSESLEKAKRELQEVKNAIGGISEESAKIDASLKHAEEHKNQPDVQCPKCAHHFSTKYDPKQLEAFSCRKKILEEKLVERQKRVDELTVFVEECTSFGQYWRRFISITTNAPVLRPYWHILTDKANIRQNPKAAVIWLQRIGDDLRRRTEIQQLETKFTERNALLQSMRLVGSDDLQTLSEKQRELEERVSVSTAQLRHLQQTQTAAQQDLQRLKQFNAAKQQLKTLIRNKLNVAKESKEQLRRQVVNQLIRSLQSELAQREQRIGTAKQQKAIIASLQAQIAQLSSREEALSVLVKELSPTEGIIAEGLMGFMNSFVDQMNSIIRAVWSYPLVIQTCEMVEGESVDLDYLFPMKVPNSPKPVPDVSKGSAGMIEIINLAYKITAMRCLKLDNAPLILDELGAAMDAQHKAETVSVIRSLVDQKTFPQVFFISHDFAQYGALANCQIALLNNMNVVAPPGSSVNKHISFS